MVYFYCCDVVVQGKVIGQSDGCKELPERIKTTEDFKKAKKMIREDVLETLAQAKLIPMDLALRFTAFNPL